MRSSSHAGKRPPGAGYCFSEDEEYVRTLGADVVIDYRATRFESVARDVDLVLDLIGGDTQERSSTYSSPAAI